MIQQVMTAPGEIIFRKVPTPTPGRGQVLVKIVRIGVCGSDIHVYHGMHPYTKYPVTQGHEVSGQIAELGEGVHEFSVGQKVTIEPQVYCGKCYPCRHGKYNLCEHLKVMGFQTTGTASEYFAVDVSKVTLLPEELSYDEGAMIEPLAVAVHAAKRFPGMKGAKVVIEGCGPIGVLLVQSVKAFGADKVMVTDVSDYRLALAKRLGADYAFNTAKTDFGADLQEAFGLVAVFDRMASADLAKLNDSELELNTTMMYRHEDYADAIRLVQEKKILLKPLMTQHFAFRDYQKAYQAIDANREKTMKVLIDVQEP